MRFNGETRAQQIARLGKWHKHFALFPVQLATGQWVWLETVMRRQEIDDTWAGTCCKSFYKELTQ